MRLLPAYIFTALFLLSGFLNSCGMQNNEQENAEVSDSTITTNSPVLPAFLVQQTVELTLPTLAYADSFAADSGYVIGKEESAVLFPGEFLFENYQRVECVAYSRFSGNVLGLWYRLTVAPAYEEMGAGRDLYLILYDDKGTPVDVYLASAADIGYSYSYVTPDSIFTVEVDEMENININTLTMGISQNGFSRGVEKMQTFDAGKNDQSVEFREAFIKSHQR